MQCVLSRISILSDKIGFIDVSSNAFSTVAILELFKCEPVPFKVNATIVKITNADGKPIDSSLYRLNEEHGSGTKGKQKYNAAILKIPWG